MLQQLWLPRLDSEYLSYEAGSWHQCGLSDLSARLKRASSPSQVVLYLPSACFIGLHKQLSQAQIAQLKPESAAFLLDNETLTPADALQIRYAPDSYGLWISAIPKQQLADFSATFKSLGAQLVAVLPDYLLLPLSAQQPLETESAALVGEGTVLLSEQTNLVRYSNYAGSGIMDPALSIKRLGLDQLGVIGAPHPKLSAQIADLNQTATTQSLGDSLSLLKPLAQPASHRLNSVEQRSYQLPTYLRVLLGLLILVWGVWLITNTYNWIQYNRAAAAYEQATLVQFKSWFPEERPSADLIRQVQEKIGVTQPAGVLMLLLERVAPVLSGFTIQAIDYRANQLNLQASVGDQAELDRLVSRLRAQQVKVQIVGSEQSQEQISAQLLLSPAVESNQS